ncbi:MAG: TonB-dependent receptor [Chitinophagaceae bacterium]|nr:TonB-dependent receptor [Chitinophagaceae bacterium]
MKFYLPASCMLILSILFRPCYAQYQVEGVVTDAATHVALHSVSVYLPELHTGTLTGDGGNYRLDHLPQGNFNIQFSFVGYETKIVAVNAGSTIVQLPVALVRTDIETQEVVIYGTRNSNIKETPKDIVSLSQETMRSNGSLSLSDAVSKLPGMSQLSTGNGISKPVIRGLYGNRIQTVLLGIRFDNQQWQDEHGLGLTDVGTDRIEVIKGPAALEYGSEAMGGVLNIIEEKPAVVGTIQGDASMQLFSNTLGFATDAGVKGATEKLNWRVRIGAESHGDYSDGNNNRVYNSRFDGYQAKLSLGWRNGNWLSVNNYLFSLNHFGFLMEADMKVDSSQRRFSRDFSGPHHTVLINMFTSENTLFKGNSKIRINLGAHINNRQEQEGGNKISLNMVLNTFNANLQWEHYVSDHASWNAGVQSMYQVNTNLGSRQIVPDAHLWENGLYAFWKETLNKLVLEGGLRYDVKNIQTFETGTINTTGSEVQPFNKWFGTLNGAAGASFNPSAHWNFKLNFSSGYRAPNLAELSSNGVHEGTYRYEIGDPEMKVEQNFNVELFAGYESRQWSATVAAYNNHFFNYVYLAPTDDEYFGYQIYRYLQENARLRGGEASVDFHPEAVEWMDFTASYSLVRGKTDAGENLPFIPADKIRGEIKFELLKSSVKWTQTFIKTGIDYVLAQNDPGQFETSTPSYYLFDIAVGSHLHFKKQEVDFSIGCNNLLNETYYDHLSRFKYFGIYNMGRNIFFNLHLPFN